MLQDPWSVFGKITLDLSRLLKLFPPYSSGLFADPPPSGVVSKTKSLTGPPYPSSTHSQSPGNRLPGIRATALAQPGAPEKDPTQSGPMKGLCIHVRCVGGTCLGRVRSPACSPLKGSLHVVELHTHGAS